MSSTAIAPPPPFFEGDHLDAGEFLSRWEALPDLVYAELIEGVVFLASPLSLDHGVAGHKIATWLGLYSAKTKGTQGGLDVTWIMDSRNVSQPDIHLRILPEYGGQSGLTAKQYGSGAPELIVEITHSSRSRDFGLKQELYARTGVREYITVETASRTIIWRQLVDGVYQDQTPASDGILRSQVFPGLWLSPAVAWDGDILLALELGLQSPEHAAFVERLASQRG